MRLKTNKESHHLSERESLSSVACGCVHNPLVSLAFHSPTSLSADFFRPHTSCKAARSKARDWIQAKHAMLSFNLRPLKQALNFLCSTNQMTVAGEVCSVRPFTARTRTLMVRFNFSFVYVNDTIYF